MSNLWRRTCFVLAALMGCVACGTGNGSEATGSLTMRLTTEVNGAVYRLSAARFDVSGPESVTLSSDDDPSASSLEVVLNAGNYDVLLRDGWRLEKRAAGADEFRAVAADLVSPNPAAFTISAGEKTNVAFAFATDGVTVDFREGALNLVIEVTETGNSQGDDCVDIGSVDDIELEVFYTEASEANQIGMNLAIRNTGRDFAISDLVVRYWFTPGTASPFSFSVDFAQTAAFSVITDAVAVSFGATAVSAFADVSVDGDAPMGLGINTIQLRLFGVNFPNLVQTDDFSFVDGATSIVNENITAYVNGVQVFGCEPPVQGP